MRRNSEIEYVVLQYNFVNIFPGMYWEKLYNKPRWKQQLLTRIIEAVAYVWASISHSSFKCLFIFDNNSVNRKQHNSDFTQIK